MLNLASTELETQKKALWYILALPIYLIEKVKPEIMAQRDPQVIKKLIFEQAPSTIYDTNDFLDELIAVIKKVFVRKEGAIMGILSTDPASQLDSLRKEVQKEFNFEYRVYQDETAKFASFLYERDFDLGIRNVRNYEQVVNALNNSETIVDIKILKVKNATLDVTENVRVII